MFDPNSRYRNLETATHTAADGREIAYVRRRFLPRPETLTPIGEAVVTDSDRLDLIAARTVGNPEFFWRVADANRAMDPADLLAPPGRRLLIAMPEAGK